MLKASKEKREHLEKETKKTDPKAQAKEEDKNKENSENYAEGRKHTSKNTHTHKETLLNGYTLLRQKQVAPKQQPKKNLSINRSRKKANPEPSQNNKINNYFKGKGLSSGRKQEAGQDLIANPVIKSLGTCLGQDDKGQADRDRPLAQPRTQQ